MVRKDAYFFYKANWNNTSRHWANEPTLHIADRRWTERTTNMIQVRTYTNLDKPALLLNGRALGKMSPLGTNIYAMEVTLADGDNFVEVTAQDGGRRYNDKVVWTYRPNPRATPVKEPRRQAINARLTVP
jgi:beta-galactosidase